MIRRSRVRWTLLALAVGAAIVAGVAQATVYQLTANATGAQEVGPVATPGTATGIFTLDDISYEFTWDVTYSGLLGTPTASHIHLGAAGVNGGVIIGLGVPSAGHYMGSAVVTATVAAQVLTQATYYNLHTNLFPGGEIRGALSQAAVPSDEKAWGAIKALYAEP